MTADRENDAIFWLFAVIIELFLCVGLWSFSRPVMRNVMCIENMNQQSIDWAILITVIVMLGLALFFGFGPPIISTYFESKIGSSIVFVAFIIYGGSGLVRGRILIGAGINRLKGFWAVLVSIPFLGIGLYGLYNLILK